jgi:bacteriorhodopsin
MIGCVALCYILYQLVWEARRHTAVLGSDVQKVYFYCGTLTAVLWTLYPIAWGLSEGGNVIAPDSEAVFYGVLDFLAKPVFGALLIFGHRNIDPARLGMKIADYDDDPSVNGREKAVPSNGHGIGHRNGNHDGVANGNNGVEATAV